MKKEADGPWAVRLLLFLLALAAPAAAAPGWEDAQWLRLGHWKRARWTGVWESDAAEGFFLAPSGRRDPRAEYEASLKALRSPEPAGEDHFRCRFPARSAWLIEREALDAAALPRPDCAKYEDWRRLLDAGAVSLIFASSYLDNPSSMFGHTFLRLERRATGGDPLRDNTLNFAAETGADGGLAFAAKGLLGLYPGKYTVMPYYMKIAEYNDMENRDLWEYSLALSSAEVDRLAAHAWELGRGTFPYYFFSKNCSYQLMPTLEAAAPRLSLMEGSPAIVGPADTLYAVRGVPGLAPAAVYRPSHATVMVERRKLMSGAEKRAAEAYAAGRFEEGDRLSAGMADARRALVLDSASDHILYKKGFSPDVPPEVRDLERGVLTRRAKAAAPPQDPPAPPWAAPPDEGHLRHRLMVGAGARNGGSFTEVAWRPGYHDLLDRPRGYLPGAAIEGLSWRLRYDRDDRRVSVRDFRLVEILSAAPWDSWTKPPSWSAGTGLDTAFELGKPADRSLVYEGHVGGGLSAAVGPGLAYALTQAEGSAGSPLRDGYAVGGALRAGGAFPLTPSLTAALDGALSGRVLGDRTPDHRLRAALNWAPARDLAVRAEGLLRGPHRELGVYATLYH
ncbi:MAG: DUF4105 domain-containing protein [Elusimicrobia bacterium]|nr:DUF4105 domain-containing protein [Elusimicrobiota bacterium]